MKKYYLLLLLLPLLCSCNKKEELQKETNNLLNITQNVFEYGEDIKLSSLITNKNITYEDIYLKTDNLGNNTLKIKYVFNDKEYIEKYDYIIQDTTAPIIYLSGSKSITTDYNKDLVKDIICIDNADKNPDCHIEGNYDIKKVGKYNLKYVATDENNNTTSKDFVLYVNKPNNNTSTSTVTTPIEDIIKKYKNENTMIGMDVSKWQGQIDFEKVKNAGVEFVMIRLGYQKNWHSDENILDPYFQRNIEEASKNGLKIGIYFYSYATTIEEGINQAKFILKNIKNYNVEFPIAFDWESFNKLTGLGISLTDLKNISYVFQETLLSAGYRPIQYGSKNYLNNFWLPVRYETWLAHYTSKANFTDYKSEYIMWQICNNGRIDGINGDVDIDIYFNS